MFLDKKYRLDYFKPLICIALIILGASVLALFIRISFLTDYARDVESIPDAGYWGKRNEETMQHENERLRKMKERYGEE